MSDDETTADDFYYEEMVLRQRKSEHDLTREIVVDLMEKFLKLKNGE